MTIKFHQIPLNLIKSPLNPIKSHYQSCERKTPPESPPQWGLLRPPDQRPIKAFLKRFRIPERHVASGVTYMGVETAGWQKNWDLPGPTLTPIQGGDIHMFTNSGEI